MGLFVLWFWKVLCRVSWLHCFGLVLSLGGVQDRAEKLASPAWKQKGKNPERWDQCVLIPVGHISEVV